MIKTVVAIAAFVNAIDTLAEYDAVYLVRCLDCWRYAYPDEEFSTQFRTGEIRSTWPFRIGSLWCILSPQDSSQRWSRVLCCIGSGECEPTCTLRHIYLKSHRTQHSITVGIIAIFSLASFAGSIGTAVETTLNPYFAQRSDAGRYVAYAFDLLYSHTLIRRLLGYGLYPAWWRTLASPSL